MNETNETNETKKQRRFSFNPNYEGRKVTVTKANGDSVLNLDLSGYPAGAPVTKLAIYGATVILSRSIAGVENEGDAISKLVETAKTIEQGRWEPGRQTVSAFEKGLNRFRKQEGREPTEQEKATIKMAADMGLIK